MLLHRLKLRDESPTFPEDSGDRAVITVDYRRYYQIIGLERNEIVRQYVRKQVKTVTV